jgi:hypothetical protein
MHNFFQSKSNISKWIFDDDSGSNVEIKYLPWAFDQPNGLSSQKCLSFDLAKTGYNDEECSSKYCIPCHLPKDAFFHLRGLPVEIQGQEILDIDYIVSIDSEKVSFDGFSGLSSIIPEPFSKKWKIVSLGQVIASNNGSRNYPIGLLSWDFFLEQNVTMNLKLTQVRYVNGLNKNIIIFFPPVCCFSVSEKQY